MNATFPIIVSVLAIWLLAWGFWEGLMCQVAHEWLKKNFDHINRALAVQGLEISCKSRWYVLFGMEHKEWYILEKAARRERESRSPRKVRAWVKQLIAGTIQYKDIKQYFPLDCDPTFWGEDK